MKHWVIVADASGARVFVTSGQSQPLEPVRELANPQGRMRTQDLVSDGPGRSMSSDASGGRSAMEPRTNAHDAAAEQFAHRLAEFLRAEASQKAFDTFSIVAPAHFLGLVKAQLSREVSHHLRGTLPRDLVHVRTEELKGHLESLLTAETFA